MKQTKINIPIITIVTYLIFTSSSFLYAQEPYRAFDYRFQSNTLQPPKVEFNGYLYFASNYLFDLELFKFDGEDAPVLVKDIMPGSDGSYPSNFIVYDDALYFTARNKLYGWHLWKLDKNDSISDIFQIPSSETITDTKPVILNGKLLFQAFNRGTISLFSYDGKSAPVILSPSNENINIVTTVKNKLIFSISDTLWEYDGIKSPYKLKDRFPSLNISVNSYNEVFTYFDKMYFSGCDNKTGCELWVYNGINAPEMVADIFKGSKNANISNFYVFNEKLYFSAIDSLNDNNIWTYNGIDSPILFFKLLNGPSTTSKFISFKGACYFFASKSGIPTLFRFDEQNAPVAISTKLSTAFGFYEYDNTLFFPGDDGIHGIELFKYTGIGEPILVKDIKSGSLGSGISSFFEIAGKLFFGANDGESGYSIWAYEGALPFGKISGALCPFYDIIFQDKLVTVSTSSTYGKELYYYNDITKQTLLLADVIPGSESSNPDNLYVFNNKLYFTAEKKDTGTELWCFDGNNAAYLVKDIRKGQVSSDISKMIGYKNKLYFNATDSTNQKQLWIYDGIQNPIKTNIASPSYFVEYKNLLYFSSTGGLWATDGVTFSLVASVNNPLGMYVHKDKMYFTANYNYYGFQLTVYDGINPPKIVNKNPTSSYNDISIGLFSFQDKLYYFNSGYLYRYDDIKDTTIRIYEHGITDKVVFKNKLYLLSDHYLICYNGKSDAYNIFRPILSYSNYSNITNSLIVYNDVLYFGVRNNIEGSLMFYLPKTGGITEYVSSCSKFTTAKNTFVTSGTYLESYTKTAKIENLHSKHVSIISKQPTIKRNENTLIADDFYGYYQWLDCNNNLASINSQTSNKIELKSGGNIALRTINKNCEQITDCFSFVLLGTTKETLSNNVSISLYPTPCHDSFFIDFQQIQQDVKIEVIDNQGRIYYDLSYSSIEKIEFKNKLPPGLYTVKVSINQEHSKSFKLVKN